MSDFLKTLEDLDLDLGKLTGVNRIVEAAKASGYDVVEVDTDKPWGAYIRFADSDAEKFIDDFFPGLTVIDAQLGIEDAPLSPKILFVSPIQRLSLQRHERRAERWRFITPGNYRHSHTDDAGDMLEAQAGEIVQFDAGDTHRLCGLDDDIVLVAEIWQHTDPNHLSDEKDIVRLEDDYSR